MAFRILLVGLVAGLGCDPPSGGQVSRWTCSALSWFESSAPIASDAAPRLAKSDPAPVPMMAVEPGPTYIPIFASEPIPAAAPAAEAVVEVPVAPAAEAVADAPPAPEAAPLVIADEGFAAVVGRMVSGYAVIDEPAGVETLLVDRVATPAEPAPWVEMPAVEAFAENPVVAEVEAEAGAGDWVGMPPTEPVAPAAPVAASAPETPRNDRLGSAVRLTGQAVQAWMSLLLQ